MACEYLDSLAKELIDAGIMTNAVQDDTGIWRGDIDTSRIFNCDETPQFINYGVDGTCTGLVYAGRGDACQKMIRENRECVTIMPFVSCSGDVSICQVVFKAKGITSAMVPPEAASQIKHLLISTAENGVSTQETFLAAAKEFDEYLEEKGVVRPVVLLSDGHSSRLCYDVMAFLLSKQIQPFLTYPDTTGVTQLLDQLNKNLHQEYKVEKASMFTDFSTLNRESFMLILANIWNTWTSKEKIINAARKVGITNHGLSVETMQQDKFERAAACMDASADDSLLSPVSSTSSSVIVSPNKRRNSAQYWENKYYQAVSIIETLNESTINIQEVPGFMSIQKVKPKLSKSKTRVTQVHGSMKAKMVLDKLKVIDDKKIETEKSKEENTKKKEDAKQAFLRCKSQCVCGDINCLAIGLKQCPVCYDILKSVCSKSKCQNDGKKPVMLLPAAAMPTGPSKSKRLKLSVDDETLEESDFSSSHSESGSDSDCEDSDINGPKSSITLLQKTWETLRPPVTEETIKGKWYGVIFSNKRCNQLFIGKVLRRLLVDENGPVESIEFRCLKPKVGSGTVIDDTPLHLPDISLFSLSDIIYGPLEVIPLKGQKFNVPLYPAVVEQFNDVNSLDRKRLSEI
jgi:hypothetical protein